MEQTTTFNPNTNTNLITKSNIRRENSIKLIKQSKYIETNPNKIILIKVIDQDFYEGRVVLKNITNNYVVYRFFNSYGMTYTISPSVYFIKPFENFTVNIKRFEKVPIDQLKTKDKFLLVAMESETTMTEINDAKNYIKKEDLYSPTTQQINLEIEIDNGTNSANYYNMINERKTIVREYNQQLNINSLTSAEEIKRYIEETKMEIERYNTQIENLMFTLKDTSTNHVVKKPNIYFDKTQIEQKLNDSLKNSLIQDSYPPFIVIFICCVGLFIGKLLNYFITI